MDIKKKLEYYRNPVKLESNTAPREKTIRERIPTAVKALAEHFNAELLYASQAPILKIRNHFECKHPLKDVYLHRLSKRQFREAIVPEQCLFFDLETTGLSGGAGTYPFLMGFGYFETDVFTIVQYFLPDFGRDYFVFKELKNLLQDKRFLISYNGKSYDLPLLKARAILNRMQTDFENLLHIDLLHFARRVWKDSQERCDLGSVENMRLGVERSVDIPGGLIPSAYTTFLNTGVIHEMVQTIEHNIRDIHSLAQLLFRLAEIEENPGSADDAYALLRLADLAFELNDYAYFQRIEKAFIQRFGSENSKLKFVKSMFLKRNGQWTPAVKLWEELSLETAYRFKALQELCKYYEHRVRDYRQAVRYCQTALKAIRVLEEINPYSAINIRSEFEKRFSRLRRKLS